MIKIIGGISKLRAMMFSVIMVLGIFRIDANAQCCYYKLNMQDSYGDGWNGGVLSAYINGTLVSNYSAAGFGTLDSIQVCNGDSLNISYTAGMYENENTYQLYDAAWNSLFNDGPNPDTGNVFITTGNCNVVLVSGSHPCTAIPIDTGQCVISGNVGFNTTGLNPGCAGYQGPDVWFQLQVPPSGSLSIATDSGSINDTGIGAWLGISCTGLQVVGCDDDGGPGYFSNLLLYGLPPGQNLYIQVFGYGGSTGTFRLCVNDVPLVVLDSSELPIIMINTLNQTIIPEVKINCLMDIKYNGTGNMTYVSDSSNIYSGNIGIEIRGLTSASYPQSPYGIETRTITNSNNNVSILGMPAENDWVLLSNFNDRSLIRNSLAFKLFGEMGNYSPRARLCEVLVDSVYEGIYVFGEKIKLDINRVDIAKLTPADTANDDLTGGYMLQQNYWNANNSFQSNYSPIDHPGFDVHFLYEYPEPDSMLLVQKTYIASYVDSLEDALYSSNFADPVNGYRKYLDVKSFIDYFLMNELARNPDGFKKSVFFHKDKNSNGGKLKAGPVWDFDWGYKNLNSCSIFEVTDGSGWAHHINDCFTDNYSTGWYIRLFQDSTFNDELRCTYENYRQTIFDTTYIFSYIDSVRSLVQNAQARHFQKWPILGLSGPAPELGDVATTYNAELDTLKSWMSIRLQWLDTNIPGLCTTSAVNENLYADTFNCFPNPAGKQLTISIDNKLINQPYRLYDFTGKLIKSGMLESNYSVIDISSLAKGVYFIIALDGYNQYSQRIIKL